MSALITPILFVFGILFINAAMYLFSIPTGLVSSGISLILIALIVDYETRAGN